MGTFLVSMEDALGISLILIFTLTLLQQAASVLTLDSGFWYLTLGELLLLKAPIFSSRSPIKLLFK